MLQPLAAEHLKPIFHAREACQLQLHCFTSYSGAQLLGQMYRGLQRLLPTELR